MGLSVTSEGGGFQKLVFENVVDTLPGGVIVDFTGYSAGVNGYMPEGTCLGRTVATGIAKPIPDPAAPGTGVEVLGLSYRDTKIEDNAMAGVVISGTARKKALPAIEQTKLAALKTALPRITLV
jgi:hypothetical protein